MCGGMLWPVKNQQKEILQIQRKLKKNFQVKLQCIMVLQKDHSFVLLARKA